MVSDTDELTELAAQFDLNTDRNDPDDIPQPIVRVMEYIRENTGLLGDYHDGTVQLAEGGQTIQWYGRGRLFSDHNDLLRWLQLVPEADDVIFAIMGIRHVDGDPTPYAEIHEADRWMSQRYVDMEADDD